MNFEDPFVEIFNNGLDFGLNVTINLNSDA